MARAGETARERACPLGACDGSGWILGPEEVARPCECRAQRLRRGRGKGVASVIPPRYRGVSLDRPPLTEMARAAATKDAVARVQKYIDALDENLERGRGLWLMGDVGTGKTTLAMLISKAVIEEGRSVAIYPVQKLLIRIKQTYEAASGEDSYAQFFERLSSVDMLYLDDLGAERQTDWVVEQLYAIVNERYEMQRSVLATCNGDPVEETKQEAKQREREGKDRELAVERQVGSRTFSRLTELCGEPILMMGKDHRLHGNYESSAAA